MPHYSLLTCSRQKCSWSGKVNMRRLIKTVNGISRTANVYSRVGNLAELFRNEILVGESGSNALSATNATEINFNPQSYA